MFIRFDIIHECDRRTDRHRATAVAVLMHRAAKTEQIFKILILKFLVNFVLILNLILFSGTVATELLRPAGLSGVKHCSVEILIPTTTVPD